MPKNQTIDSKKIQGNILVVLPKFIGDTINCTPAIKMLKTLYPNKKIYVLARPHLVEMLSRDNSIEVISDNRFDTHQPCSLLSQASILKKANIDLAIILRNSLSEALLCFAAKIKYRIGYAQNGRSPLLTHTLKLNKNHHYIYRYCRLINETHGYPFSEIPNTEVQAKKSHYIKQNKKKKLGIYFGGKNKRCRHYPEDLATQTLEKLSEEHPDCDFYIVGDPSEKDEAEQLVAKLNNSNASITNLAGQTSMLEMLDLVASLDLFITIDSGPMHIAAAANIPFVVLVGLGTSPWSTVAPKQKNYIALVANGLQLIDSELIRDIKPSQICEAVNQLI